MLLTKDNILRYIKEKKAITPTMVSEDFETTTTIASAVLSELSQNKLINITNLKLGTSPYYYDPKQPSYLIEIGNKHLSGYDKEVFLKLEKEQVINSKTLSIQESLAIERIKDYAIPLEINHNNQEFKFWVWYLRDLKETKKQILDVLKKSNQKENEQQQQKSEQIQRIKQPEKKKINKEILQTNTQEINSQRNYQNKTVRLQQTITTQQKEFKPTNSFDDKIEIFIENYFKENYLKIENKQKNQKGIDYKVKLIINKIIVEFDCFYFYKKPTDTDLIQFYASSIKPKIIFIQNVSKRLSKMVENLENLTIINI